MFCGITTEDTRRLVYNTDLDGGGLSISLVERGEIAKESDCE